MRLGASFTEVIGDLNIKRTERASSQVEAHVTWDDGNSDVLVGPVDLFDRESTQSIRDWDLQANLQFRMHDAVPIAGGYLLPSDAFELIDTRDEDAKGESDKGPCAVSVVLRRPQRRSIDF